MLRVQIPDWDASVKPRLDQRVDDVDILIRYAYRFRTNNQSHFTFQYLKKAKMLFT